MGVYENLTQSLVRDYITEQQKAEKKKASLLEDPKKLDIYVGKIFQQLSPSERLASKSKAELLTDRVDAKIDKSHPFKGFGQELKKRLGTELAKPRSQGYDLENITSSIVEQMLNKRDSKSRLTRLEQAYERKRIEDTAFFGDKVKAPLPLPGMPTYEEWRKQKFAEEKERTSEDFSFRNYLKSVAGVGLASAGVGAVAGIWTGPGSLLSAGSGATYGVLSEAILYPLRQIAKEKSEWVSSREYSSRLRDRLKVIGLEIGVESVGAAGISKVAKLTKAVAKSTIFAKGAAEEAFAKPTASKVVNAAKAEKFAETETKIAINGSDIPGAERLLKLPKKLQKEALAHPEGLEKGLEIAEEKADALAHTTGEKVSPKVKVSKTAKEVKTEVKSTKELKEASQEVGKEAAAGEDTTLLEDITKRKGTVDELAERLRKKVRKQQEERRIEERRQSVTEVPTERRAVERRSFNAQETDNDINKLEESLVGKKMTEIGKSPKARVALKPVKFTSSTEDLVTAPMKKADEEILSSIPEGGLVETGKKELPIFTKEDVQKDLKDLIKQSRAGTISPADELARLENAKTALQTSTHLDKVDRANLLRSISGRITRMNKTANVIKGLALLGVGDWIFNLFSPQEAEASVVSSAGKIGAEVAEEVAPKAVNKLLGLLKSSGLIAEKVVADDVFVMSEKYIQKGLKESTFGGPKMVLENVQKYLKVRTGSVRRSLMSTHQQFNEIFKLEDGIMNNPGNFFASYMLGAANNTENGLRIASNILRDAGIKSSAREIREEFAHLAPLMENQVGHDFYVKRIGDLTQELKKAHGVEAGSKATIEDIKSIKQQLAIAKKNVDKYRSGMEDFHAEFNSTAHVAALKYPSARVFFAAADDMQKWTKYPFMKNVVLSEEEVLAAGRIKRLMKTYKGRLEANGVETRSGDFMHHMLHPDVKATMMEKLTGDIGAAPYLKNYSRSLNSRPLMPDVFATLGDYIPDVERRMSVQGFWNSGWRKVMNKTRFIEPVRVAFEALENGLKPIERSFGNDLARWYTNFEVFKRLFFTPSAGLKHLIKMTGNMANLGAVTTLRSIPAAVKGVTWRLAENTPFLKSLSRKYFENAGEFNKLRKALFDSVVPVQNTRWRMLQAGFSDYDSYFSKLAVLADKVNYAGGFFINLAELIDRGVSVEAGLRIALKKGYTAEQAMYGIYDTILKNNFLGGAFTPRWLKRPNMKALLLFQTTPAKILERRLVTAVKAGRQVEGFGKAVLKATKTAEGRQKLFQDLLSLRKDMKLAERELKTNIFLDVLRSEQDFYGNSAVKQFAKDLIITGAATIGGAEVGMNLWHHFFHVPFTKSNYGGNKDVVLSLSPAIQTLIESSDRWSKRDEYDEFFVTKTVQDWLGRSGPFPDIISKLNRINEGDIPEIYQDSRFKYLFSIPSTHE
jgi:hypothetical protein